MGMMYKRFIAAPNSVEINTFKQATTIEFDDIKAHEEFAAELGNKLKI